MLFCEHGFATDDNGCQLCVCIDAPPPAGAPPLMLPQPPPSPLPASCPEIMCRMACEHGYKTDDNGCQLCVCVDAPSPPPSPLPPSLLPPLAAPTHSPPPSTPLVPDCSRLLCWQRGPPCSSVASPECPACSSSRHPCSWSNASGEAGGRRAPGGAGERSSAVGDNRGDKVRRGGLAAARPAEANGCSGAGEAKRGAGVEASSGVAVGGGGGGCERSVRVARESCRRKQMWRVETARETRGATAASG